METPELTRELLQSLGGMLLLDVVDNFGTDIENKYSPILQNKITERMNEALREFFNDMLIFRPVASARSYFSDEFKMPVFDVYCNVDGESHTWTGPLNKKTLENILHLKRI
ncbi:hypothetical protein JXB27_01925 [Candidatus Woesearchaeota archaeon]|nr:hypothetical protein [Candidatus Woesearchaeota archaeon]